MLGAVAEAFPFAVQGRRRPGVRILMRVLRTGRRTLVESLYLLTGPATAAAGLLLVPCGLCARTAGLLVPGGSRLTNAGLAPARWCADVESAGQVTVASGLAGEADRVDCAIHHVRAWSIAQSTCRRGQKSAT
jgi:hypothetical protein